MSSSCKKNTHFTQFDGFLEQRVTWEHSGVYVDPCGQVFPSSRTNTQSFYSHLPGHTHGHGNSHDSQHASGPGHASGSGHRHNHAHGHQHSQGASSGPRNTPRPGLAPGPRHHHSHSHAGRASSHNHGPPSPPEHPFQPQQEPEEEERVQKEESGYEHAEGEESHQAPPPGNRDASRLMTYLQEKQVQDLTNKIVSLREAFHSLLTQDTTKNFLLVAGRMILSGLVQLNQVDVSSISTSFNRLVSYIEDPAHRAGIERELASVNIHHTNFLDIVYDFIILGVMKNNAALPPQNKQEQGFLDHLFKVLEPILTPPTGWQPCAKMFQEVLQVQLMKLLDSILDLDESTFSQADVLSAVLFSRLEGIIQELLGDLDGC
ncbi:uncharacterized protein LOC134024904 isoform X1 [Osmerus eperlanus]|uniref:uncharacterized protein LOC134024904 isoform X1 n=1 Tax=Osmerus eperlanus TaxID=29151 RepID=UPI002E0EA40F